MAVEDPERVAKIRARHPGELQMVVRENLPAMLRAARATGLSADLAEDVVQATFLTFVEKADRFDGRAQVRTWLFGILYNKIAESRRGLKRDQTMEDIDEVMQSRFNREGSWTSPPQPADFGLAREEIRKEIQECMEGLPDRHRAAFVLREIEDLSTEEICKILEITRTNLGVVLYRGRNSLRECLEAKGLKGSEDASV